MVAMVKTWDGNQSIGFCICQLYSQYGMTTSTKTHGFLFHHGTDVADTKVGLRLNPGN